MAFNIHYTLLVFTTASLLFSCTKEDQTEILGDNNEPEEISTVVSTADNIEVSPCSATLFGSTKATITDDTEVGFQLATNRDFKEVRIIKVNKISNKSFNTVVKGLLDQYTYYYRSYITTGKETKYGAIKKFTTPELTYSINGNTYKLITVNGPYGKISMMQTELPLIKTTKFSIGDFSVDFSEFSDINSKFTRSYYKDIFLGLWTNLGHAWRIPTQEEWMIAAMEGDISNTFKYSGSNNIDDVAWYSGNSVSRANWVAQKQPNKLGFYDMSGNFSEFVCNRIYPYIEERNYETVHFIDDMFHYAIACGGNWTSSSADCTVFSYYSIPSTEYSYIDNKTIAFRLVFLRDPLHCMSWATK